MSSAPITRATGMRRRPATGRRPGVPRRAGGRSVVLATALGLLAATLAGLLVYGGVTTPRIASRAPLGATADRTPTLRVRLAHAPGLTTGDVRLTVDGADVDRSMSIERGVLSAPLPVLHDGRHAIHLRTRPVGLFRRRLDARWSIRVDTAPPPLALTTPRNSPTASNSRNLVVGVATEPGVTVAVQVRHGGRVVRSTNDIGRARATVRLHEGRNRLYVTARDAAGNVTTRRIIVHVDSIEPIVRMPLSARRIADVRPTVMAMASDDRGAVTVAAAIDGEPAEVRGTGPYQVLTGHDLSEGRHEFSVTAADHVGNQTTETRSVIVDSSESLGDNAVGRGALGMDVRDLQRALERKGFWNRRKHPQEWRTMRYGASTASAVCGFQRDRGLGQDCVAGKDTIAVMTLKIVISRAGHTLTLYRSGEIVRSYGVAVGSPTYPTPTGDFEITSMEENPTWTPPPDSEWAKDAKPIPPGPNNPLGTRFMRLSAPPGTVGIHGTPNPASIGYSVSHGCIRMAIPDVEDLFARVSAGTPVSIV